MCRRKNFFSLHLFSRIVEVGIRLLLLLYDWRTNVFFLVSFRFSSFETCNCWCICSTFLRLYFSLVKFLSPDEIQLPFLTSTKVIWGICRFEELPLTLLFSWTILTNSYKLWFQLNVCLRYTLYRCCSNIIKIWRELASMSKLPWFLQILMKNNQYNNGWILKKHIILRGNVFLQWRFFQKLHFSRKSNTAWK